MTRIEEGKTKQPIVYSLRYMYNFHGYKGKAHEDGKIAILFNEEQSTSISSVGTHCYNNIYIILTSIECDTRKYSTS